MSFRALESMWRTPAAYRCALVVALLFCGPATATWGQDLFGDVPAEEVIDEVLPVDPPAADDIFDPGFPEDAPAEELPAEAEPAEFVADGSVNANDPAGTVADSSSLEPIVRPARPCAKLNVKSLKEIATLGDNRFRHAASLIHIAVLPGGKQVLASAEDGAARLWDAETGKELQRFYNGQGGYVWNCASLYDGKQVLTCGVDKRVTRWDAATGKMLHRYEQQHSTFRLAVAPGSETFAASGDGNRTIVWNTESGERVRSLRGHSDSVYGAAIDDEGRFLVTCGDDKTIRVYDFAEGNSRHRLTNHTGAVYTAAFAPKSVRFATCGDDHSVRVWDAESGEQAWSVPLSNTVYVVAWSPDGARIAATCSDSHIYILDANGGKEIAKIKVPQGYHWPVAYSPDGASLYSGGSGVLWRWDATTGKQLFPNPEEKPLIGSVENFAISPDGATIYLCGEDNRLHVWSVAEKKRIACWPMEKAIVSLDISPDGKKLLAGDDANAHILDTQTGKPIATIKCGDGFSSAGFVDNARRVVTTSSEAMAQVWEAGSGSQIGTLFGHLKSIESLATAMDGDRIVTSSDDGTVRIWGAHSGKELSRIGTPNEDGTTTMQLPTFLADNRSLVVVDNDKQLRVWLAPSLEDTSSVTSADIERLVADLSSEKYPVRQAATEALVKVAGKMREQIQNVSADDPEVVWRLRQIMLGVERGETPTAPLGSPLTFDDSPQSLAVHPDGLHFAAVLRADAAAKIVIGCFTKDGPRKIETIETGHSPGIVAFSADGRRLFAANRDGTVSVFEASAAP
jgi:WD40 repeat protein